MKKQLILLTILLLIIPTILAQSQINLPSQEPATKSLIFNPSCYAGRLTNINQQIFSGTLPLLIFLFIIDTIFKGFALWKAQHKNHKIWFIIILVLSTAGILPIIYLILNRKNTHSKKTKPTP